MNQRDCLVCDLWHAGVHADEIGRRLGVSASRVYSMANRLQLPRRGRQESQADDPTPEEIELRKAEIRERHLASRRAEPPEVSSGRASQQRKRQRALA